MMFEMPNHFNFNCTYCNSTRIAFSQLKALDSDRDIIFRELFMANIKLLLAIGVSTVSSAFTQIPTKKVSSVSPQTSRSTPTIIVLQPLNFTRTLKDDIVYIGDRRYTLKCDIISIRTPVKVWWTFDGKRLNGSRNVLIRKLQKNKFRLRIRHLTKHHSGVYGCHVSDGLGRIIKSYGTLQVIKGTVISL